MNRVNWIVTGCSRGCYKVIQGLTGCTRGVTGCTGGVTECDGCDWEEKKEGKYLQTGWQAGIEGSTRDPRGPQNIPSFALDPSFP